MADKSSGSSAFRWIVRIIVVVALAYFFHPLYMPPSATQASLEAGDSVTVRFYEFPENPEIYQSLTLRGDGSNVVEIARQQGDPDLPPGGGWDLKSDRDKKLIRFTKQNLLDTAKGKRLFQQLVEAGLIDLAKVDGGAAGNKLEISYAIGSRSAEHTGPAHVERAYHWNPTVWKNQQRWLEVIQLLKDDSELRPLLTKTDIILVNE